MGKKILCGKFAQRLNTNFAVGDEDNNLILYNTLTSKPITVLNSQASNVSSITALTFTQSDDQIVVGSNRGSMNIWDLNTLKSNNCHKLVGCCLKGHTIEVCSFYADRKNENIIASGSFDTNVKIWDLRSKNCIHTLKNHSRKVSALNIALDSRTIVTGGEDGVVYTFDIRMVRPVFQY
jgi:katanin p80 WD40 repeat-containing subunit B1